MVWPRYYLDQLLGQALTRDFRADETMTLEAVRPATGASTGRAAAGV